jgi:hypothetical protein
MGLGVSPKLVLDLCRSLGKAAELGMSLLFLTLPGSPDQLLLHHYLDIVFQEHQR